MIEKLVHSSDGRLRPDLPYYLIPGTKVRLKKADAYFGRPAGATGEINERTIEAQKLRDNSVYVRVANLRTHSGTSLATTCWVLESCLEVIDE